MNTGWKPTRNPVCKLDLEKLRIFQQKPKERTLIDGKKLRKSRGRQRCP